LKLMRYCNFCHRMTTGQPLFCNFCGHSYDVKLCPARHVNPRVATVCSQCGSHDLSTPEPPSSLAKRTLFLFLRVLPGFLLLLITTAFFLALVRAFLQSPALQAQLFFIGLFLGGLWWLYLQIPAFIRNRIGRHGTKRKKGGHEGH